MMVIERHVRYYYSTFNNIYLGLINLFNVFMKWFFSASALVCMLGALAFVGTTYAQSTSCHLYDRNELVPQGFAAAYNLITSAREQLVRITCDRSAQEVEIEVGNGDQYMYIYEGGYYVENGQWVLDEDMYSGQTRIYDSNNQPLKWFSGNVRAELSNRASDLDDEHYILAYMCQWTGSVWKCGCQNTTCSDAQSTWTLQTYNYPAAPSSSSSSGSTSSGSTSSGSSSGSSSSSSGGSSSSSSGGSSSSSSGGSSSGSQAQTVTIDTRSKNFEFDVTNITVNQGDTVVINLTNDEGVHDWKIDEFNAQTAVLDAAGQTDSISFVADQAGTFEFYCSIPGHRQLGMVGTLTVN